MNLTAAEVKLRAPCGLNEYGEPLTATPGARRALAAEPAAAQWTVLADEARRLGVDVKRARLYGERGYRGVFIPARSLILLDAGLNTMQRFETLAHELGHAFYGHDVSTAESERDAWVRAATLTIDGTALRAAERVNPSCEAIALALRVSPCLVWGYLLGASAAGNAVPRTREAF